MFTDTSADESPFFPYKLRERQWERVFECRGALLYDFLPSTQNINSSVTCYSTDV